MKSIFKTSLKLAPVVLVLVLGIAASAQAQGGKIELAQLDQLAAKASQSVDVNLDERLMRLTLPFSSNDTCRDWVSISFTGQPRRTSTPSARLMRSSSIGICQIPPRTKP